jgi:hypothetical protein
MNAREQIVTAIERVIERERIARATPWRRNYPRLKFVRRADITNGIGHPKLPARLRLGEFAEIFIATSGVSAVLATIVLGMTVMVRAIRSFHRS